MRARGKPRLVLVVQSAALLKVDHPTILVIPLTGKLVDDAEPLRVRVPAMDKLRRDWDLAIDQICAIDNVHLDRWSRRQIGRSAIGASR